LELSITARNQAIRSYKPSTSLAFMQPFLLALLLLPGLAWADEPTPIARQEIAHLVDYLKNSNCQFNRNGSWHSSSDAAKHLDQKYQYLLKKGLASTAEEFIERAGTQSSISGQPYQVRCHAESPAASKTWLSTELTAYRAARRGQSK
jgi:hypothetical protein